MANEFENYQVKSKERIQAHGEVFTRPQEVKAMLDMVKNESERVDSRILEPACGTGNFVVEVLRRKLDTVYKKSNPKDKKRMSTAEIVEYEKLSLLAVACIYGIDIMIDNVIECRKRLYTIWYNTFIEKCKKTPDLELCKSVEFILTKNILCGNTLSMKQVNEKTEDIELPIIISEWNYVIGNNIQRKDYKYDVLVSGILPDNETSENYIKNERNYLKGYITNYKEIWKYA